MRAQTALALLLLTAACSGGSKAATPATSTSAPAPTTTASEDPGPTTSPDAQVVTGAGSRFTEPKSPTTKQRQNGPAGDHCYGLADADFTTVSCQAFASKLGKALAVVETRGQQERDLVWLLTDTTASLGLRATRTAASGTGTGGDAGVTTRVSIVDLAEDTTPKAVFLTPKGSGYDAIADVDVVEASGKVVIHRDAGGGKVGKANGGGLAVLVPTSGGGSVEDVIQYVAGAWRVTAHKPATSQTQVQQF